MKLVSIKDIQEIVEKIILETSQNKLPNRISDLEITILRAGFYTLIRKLYELQDYPEICPHGHLDWDDCPDCCH